MRASGYLIFEMHGEVYAAALEDVAEITDPPTFYPLPKVPRYYRGVINCHGRPTPVIDLSLICKDVPTAAPGKIIVLRGKSINLALLVDNAVNVRKGDLPSEPPAGYEPGVERVILTSEGAVKVIGPEKLIALLQEEING